MTRQIVTRKDALSAAGAGEGARKAAAGSDAADSYITRILKYIPVEVIALFALVNSAIQGSATQASSAPLSWAAFALVTILTPVYLWRVQRVTRIVQLLVSTSAFGVWVFYVGGPFTLCDWYQPVYGAVLLPIFTFGIGLIEPDR